MIAPNPAQGLLAYAETEQTAPKQCRLMSVRESMPEEMQQELDIMLSDTKRYTVSLIHRALKANGYKLGRDAVTRHSQGSCSCR